MARNQTSAQKRFRQSEVRRMHNKAIKSECHTYVRQFVEAVQARQGFYIACLEEIAWRRGFITDDQLRAVGEELKMTEYGKYILSLLD